MGKPPICLDFDAVIHSFESPMIHPSIVSDLPVPGALSFILALMESFEVNIHSVRSGKDGGISAMRNWLGVHFVHAGLTQGEAIYVVERIKWPVGKPDAIVYIDDRAIPFDGDWSKFDVEELRAFKPWNHHLRHPPG